MREAGSQAGQKLQEESRRKEKPIRDEERREEETRGEERVLVCFLCLVRLV